MGSTKEFWEVSERGDNFAYMPPKYAEYLDGFFGWFGWFAKRDEQAQADFWNTKGSNINTFHITRTVRREKFTSKH